MKRNLRAQSVDLYTSGPREIPSAEEAPVTPCDLRHADKCTNSCTSKMPWMPSRSAGQLCRRCQITGSHQALKKTAHDLSLTLSLSLFLFKVSRHSNAFQPCWGMTTPVSLLKAARMCLPFVELLSCGSANNKRLCRSSLSGPLLCSIMRWTM